MGRGGEVLGFGFFYLWWKWIQNLLALEPTLMVMPAPFSFNFNTWCIITGVLTAQVPWKCFSVVKLCMQYFYFGNCSLKEVAVQKWPENTYLSQISMLFFCLCLDAALFVLRVTAPCCYCLSLSSDQGSHQTALASVKHYFFLEVLITLLAGKATFDLICAPESLLRKEWLYRDCLSLCSQMKKNVSSVYLPVSDIP